MSPSARYSFGISCIVVALAACSRAAVESGDLGLEIEPESAPSITATIPPDGAAVEFGSVGRFDFPPRAFERPTKVRIFTTDWPGTLDGRVEYHMVGGGPDPYDGSADPLTTEPPPVRYDIHITGEAEPALPFDVMLHVPESYLETLPTEFTPRLFAELESGSDLEVHHYIDPIPAEWDAGAKVLRAAVWRPNTRWRRRDGRFEVILLIGSRLHGVHQ